MSTKVSAKKAGKENAPPSKHANMIDGAPDVTMDDVDPLDDEMSDGPTNTVSKSRPLSSSQTLKSNKPPTKTSKVTAAPAKSSFKPPKSIPPSHSRAASDSKAKSGDRDAEEADEFDNDMVDIDEVERDDFTAKGRIIKAVGGKKVAIQEDEEEEDGVSEELGRKVADLERQLLAAKSSLKRTQEERDNFARQFEKLSTVNANDEEIAFGKYKEKAEARAKAQNELIATLSNTNEKLQVKVKDAERRAAAPAPSLQVSAPASAAAPTNDTIEKVKAAAAKELRTMRDQIAQMSKEMVTKDEQLATLQKDYQAEIRLSKEAAIKRATGSAVTPAPSTAESAKDTLLIKLYEDLTNLSVPIIKTKEGGSGLEVTFVCVQTVDGRSLSFRLRCYNQYVQEEGQEGKYIKKIDYEPLHLDKEQDQAFIERLDMFNGRFAIPRDQGYDLIEKLRLNMMDVDSPE